MINMSARPESVSQAGKEHGTVIKSPETWYKLSGLQSNLESEAERMAYVVDGLKSIYSSLTLGQLIDKLQEQSFTHEQVDLAQAHFLDQQSRERVKIIELALINPDITEGKLVDLMIELHCDTELIRSKQQRFRQIQADRAEANKPKMIISHGTALVLSQLNSWLDEE
jgi:hypothetical protein